MRAVTLAAVLAWWLVAGYGIASFAAIRNDRFVATWDVPAQSAVYEFRWRHFAAADWIALPAQPSSAGTFRATFQPLPAIPTTDRWMCLDARSVRNGQAGTWISETTDGAACNTVEVGVIPVPTPPPPTPPAPPEPQPDIFTNIQQSAGRLSLDYQLADCPRGVQQATSAAVNGRKTITLRCRS